MSTNITSTSNGEGGTQNGASRPKAEGVRGDPFVSMPLPDPVVLERLANEFYRAFPKDVALPDAAPEPEPEEESEAIPTSMFSEMLSPKETSGVQSSSSMPASPVYTEPGPLTETDLRAIAATVAGETVVLPGTHGNVPALPVVGAATDLLAGGKVPPSLPHQRCLRIPSSSRFRGSRPRLPPLRLRRREVWTWPPFRHPWWAQRSHRERCLMLSRATKVLRPERRRSCRRSTMCSRLRAFLRGRVRQASRLCLILQRRRCHLPIQPRVARMQALKLQDTTSKASLRTRRRSPVCTEMESRCPTQAGSNWGNPMPRRLSRHPNVGFLSRPCRPCLLLQPQVNPRNRWTPRKGVPLRGRELTNFVRITYLKISASASVRSMPG